MQLNDPCSIDEEPKVPVTFSRLLPIPRSERGRYKMVNVSLGMPPVDAPIKTEQSQKEQLHIDAIKVSPDPSCNETSTDENASCEELDALQVDIEEDYSETVIEELESLQSEFAIRQDAPSTSLANKLKVDDNFQICPGSFYRSDTWKLPHSKNNYPNNIRFNRELSGSNDLKRALIYHAIPEFSPFSSIRSYLTTKAFGNEYAIFEKYIFIDNGLSARPEHIRLISVPMILGALERSKEADAKAHCFYLFKFLRLWMNLTAQKLIPEEFYLDVPRDQIDTFERRRDVLDSRFRGTFEGWVSYSEEDLEELMSYVSFWLDGAAPKLMKLKQYLVEMSISNYEEKVVTRRYRLSKLEELSTIVIDGKTVMSPTIREFFKDGAQYYTYSWIKGYGQILENVRNAIFILTALVTGARKAELSAIHFEDISTDENGDYWIKITRTKTAPSPMYGEADLLPLPKFVGDAITQFEELRSLAPFVKEGWLFQPNRSVRSVLKATPSLINNIIVQLKSELSITRLHCHRFRKTIAEILINRDERNIDIIRTLFGHRSYAMTLQYIARNPLMVRSVAIAIEQSYTREFQEIVAGIRFSGYSGESAKRIYQQVLKRPEEFSGKQLKTNIVAYVSHLLEAGEPLFIRRTAVGTFCLTGEHFTANNLPPCLVGRKTYGDIIMPDPSNCQPDCKKIVVLESARHALQDSVQFYSKILEATGGKLAAGAERDLNRRIKAAQLHLDNLNTSNPSPRNFAHIEVVNV